MPAEKSRSHSKFIQYAGVLIILAGFIALTWRSVSSQPYIYDEADYLSATARGAAANALEFGSTPVVDLVKIAFERRGAGERQSLSEWVRSSNDVSFYRHWHGPLIFYYLMLVNSAGPAEWTHRAAMLLFPLITIVVTWFGCWRILPAHMRAGGALLTSALVGWNFVATRSSEIAPHQLYVLTFVTALMLLAIAITEGQRHYWYAAVAVTALAFVTLEMAMVLILVLLLTAWTERAALRTDASMIWRSAALFLAIVLALWPAAILRISFLKAWFSLAYIAFFRKPWGEMTLGDAWRLRLAHSPVQWALIAVAFALFLLRIANRRDFPLRRIALPFLLFGGLTFLLLARVASDSARYDLPYAQALDIFAGLVLTAVLYEWSSRARILAITAVAAGCFATTWAAMQATREIPSPQIPHVLEAVREDRLERARILAPQNLIPVLHYYFPGTTLRPYSDAAPTTADLGASVYDAVIEPDNHVERLREANGTGRLR